MPGDITQLLRQAAGGEQSAVDELYRLTYQQLQHIARGQRGRHRRPAAALNTTALVHEAFLKLERASDVSFHDREHFFAVAARAMRQLLVDQARNTLRDKRGAGAQHRSLDEALEPNVEPLTSVLERTCTFLDLNDALNELGKTNDRLLRVVECKVFAGMEETEIATALQVHTRTVRRDWAKARAWLSLRLSEPYDEGVRADLGSGPDRHGAALEPG
jgi:RNA polymerase sigma factor (TIGR02999 family)